MVFLHGYMSAENPRYEMLRDILAKLGVDLWYAVAPRGRVDTFNKCGDSSWFRYRTDNTDAKPIAFDRPDSFDVRETLDKPVVSVTGYNAPNRPMSLLDIINLARENGKRRILLCGESQGGIMASILASEHLFRLGGMDNALLGVFLLRSAPDPMTWSPMPWPSSKYSYGLRTTWGAFVGGDDSIFPEAFVRYALSPVPGAKFHVAAGVTHYEDGHDIYKSAMETFANWAFTTPRS